jgi:hypothetical protein
MRTGPPALRTARLRRATADVPGAPTTKNIRPRGPRGAASARRHLGLRGRTLSRVARRLRLAARRREIVRPARGAGLTVPRSRGAGLTVPRSRGAGLTVPAAGLVGRTVYLIAAGPALGSVSLASVAALASRAILGISAVGPARRAAPGTARLVRVAIAAAAPATAARSSP